MNQSLECQGGFSPIDGKLVSNAVDKVRDREEGKEVEPFVRISEVINQETFLPFLNGGRDKADASATRAKQPVEPHVDQLRLGVYLKHLIDVRLAQLGCFDHGLPSI
ncbi:hypothetical protein D9M69_450150 [compost metagenome]